MTRQLDIITKEKEASTASPAFWGDKVYTLYISGGFSAKINVANAVKTGLLPAELEDRCVAVNNSSLLGTVKYACEHNDLSVYLDRMQYVDLASDPVFSDLFIQNMTFEEM